MSELWWIAHAAVGQFGRQMKGAVLANVHDPIRCEGQGCSLHHPSDHHMKDWSLNWRDDRKIVERICPHGVGHPDPDDLVFLRSIGRRGVDAHGCCGCCAPAPDKFPGGNPEEQR